MKIDFKKILLVLSFILLFSSCSKEKISNKKETVKKEISNDKNDDFKEFENYIGKEFKGKMGGFITVAVEKNYSYMKYEAPNIDPDDCSSKKVRKLHGKFQRYGIFLEPKIVTRDFKKFLTAMDFPEDKFYIKNDYTIVDTETGNEYICAENKN